MEYRISRHAKQEIEKRNIPVDIVDGILVSPDQIVEEYDNKKAYQSIIQMEDGKSYLVRVIVNNTIEPAVVVTVYRTSKISKYWREP